MEYALNTVTSADLLSPEAVVDAKALGKQFLSFINEYKTTHKLYFQILHSNITQNIFNMQVQLDAINQFSPKLYDEMLRRPEFVLAACESAICREYGLKTFQLQLISSGIITKIRDIDCNRANRIVKIQGIVTSVSKVITKPVELFVTCRNCLNSKMVKEAIPRTCDKTECPLDPFIIVPEKSKVIDIQYAKIQEHFEDIPVGETPRHFNLCLEGDLVEKISPGNQVKLTGIFCIKNAAEKSVLFIRVLGVENTKNKLKKSFTDEEEMYFKELSKQNIYERFSRSIAPSIYGHEDIKKAIACLLFGGTRRKRDDGIVLRGDINILLLGDPGIAKSQLLKFVETVSPISVYTSGRGSSAAGLTASVIRDKNREFYLEGGALVLADNGVCCIDEFDKMNEGDRVAIHEAMEQQTISIAKAGITTVLNTRASILAAANPVFGRYDDYKTPAENIEFGSTILSRFDCIFIIKDKSGPNDKIVAEHVLNLHKGKTESKNLREDSQMESGNKVDTDTLSLETMRNYIQYAKSKVFPTLTEAAAAKLNKFYVGIREQVRNLDSDKKSSIPITVRQLEAIVRISESLAKIELSSSVSPKHVDEAIRLFQLSTMNAVSQGHMIEGMTRPSFFDEINEVIQKIKDFMPIGSSRRFSDIVSNIRCQDSVVKRAVDYMIKQNKLMSKDYGRVLVRLP